MGSGGGGGMTQNRRKGKVVGRVGRGKGKKKWRWAIPIMGEQGCMLDLSILPLLISGLCSLSPS